MPSPDTSRQGETRSILDRLITFAGRAGGYTLLLGIGLALFLLASGLNGQALPFIPGTQYSDAVISHWPNALYFQRVVQGGTFPFWRPLILSGQPFATNPLNKVWYPFEWALLLVPPILYLNATLWLHLLLAGVGMRTLVRSLGLPTEIASLLGLIYAFTPRLLALSGAGHWDAVAAWSWLPWLLWAVGTVRWRWIVVFGALCFLADVRTAALVFALALAFAIWQHHRRKASQYAIAMLLGLIGLGGLTAVQWLPLLVALPNLSRGGLTLVDAGIFSLSPPGLIGLLFSVRGGSQETMVYAGVGVLALAILGGISTWRRTWFWIVVIIAAAAYAFGVNSLLWPLLVKLVPALLWLRVPARAWQLGIFALIVLSGYGLQIVFDPVKRAARRRLITRLSVGLIGTGILLAVIVLPVAPTSAVIALLLVIICGALLLARIEDRRSVFALWTVVIAFDLLLMDSSLLRGRDQSQWLDVYQPLAQALIADHAERVYASPVVLPQQAAAYWKINTFGGVDPFQFSSYVALNRRVNPLASTDYSVVLPNFAPGVTNSDWAAVLDLKLLATWQVSHLVLDSAIDLPALRLVREMSISSQSLYIYANLEYRSGRLVGWSDANHVTLRADDTTDGVLPDLHGWTRLVTADGLATYSYAPPEIFIGIGLSLVTLLFLLGSWLPVAVKRGRPAVQAFKISAEGDQP